MSPVKLFLVVLVLSALSFGGGNSLLAGLDRELVQTRVITPAEFQTGMALGQSTPGPLAAVLLMGRIPRSWFELPPVKSSLGATIAYLVAVIFVLAYQSMVRGNHERLIGPAVIFGLVLVGRLLKAPTVVLMLAAVGLGMLLQGTAFAGW